MEAEPDGSEVYRDPPPDLPTDSGIYMFVVAPYCGGIRDHSYIFYVRKAKNIKTRYKNYLAEKAGTCDNPREAVMLFLNDFEDYLYFHFTPIHETELDSAEKLLKDNLTPYANTQLPIIGKLTTQ